MINGGSNKDKNKLKTYRTSPPRRYSLSMSSASLINVICDLLVASEDHQT